MNILISLFLTFAKIGIVGFGGGMAILALIYQSMLQNFFFTDIILS